MCPNAPFTGSAEFKKPGGTYMNMNLTKKILAAHLAKPSDMVPGEEIFL